MKALARRGQPRLGQQSVQFDQDVGGVPIRLGDPKGRLGRVDVSQAGEYLSAEQVKAEKGVDVHHVGIFGCAFGRQLAESGTQVTRGQGDHPDDRRGH